MSDKKYPTLADRPAWMRKVREASKKGLCGLTLLTCVGLAPRCGGVMEGHPARSAVLSKAEVRQSAASDRVAHDTESPEPAPRDETTGL
jgi:hypothetical protein